MLTSLSLCLVIVGAVLTRSIEPPMRCALVVEGVCRAIQLKLQEGGHETRMFIKTTKKLLAYHTGSITWLNYGAGCGVGHAEASSPCIRSPPRDLHLRLFQHTALLTPLNFTLVMNPTFSISFGPVSCSSIQAHDSLITSW
jgi:hypothetical protein